MPIQKEIVLRYQAPGHVRFQLPDRLCTKNVAAYLQQAILQWPGVYRVSLYRKQQKLSIRYIDEVCNFALLARQLSELLNHLEENGYPNEEQDVQAASSRNIRILSRWPIGRWFREKYTETRETVHAAGVLARFGLKNKPGLLKNPEKTLTDFFNDVLVLYLIKTHWHIITQHWLLKPVRYRYEWMASFYLMYLLIRSKIPKS